MIINIVSHWIHEELTDIYIRSSGSAWLDETNGFLKLELGPKPWHSLRKFPTGQSWYYQFPETWWMVLEAWY